MRYLRSILPVQGRCTTGELARVPQHWRKDWRLAALQVLLPFESLQLIQGRKAAARCLSRPDRAMDGDELAGLEAV